MVELLLILALAILPLSVVAVRAQRTRTFSPLFEAARGVAAGAVAGLLWAVGARAAMRAVAVAAGDPTEFSVGGTLAVLGVGAVLGSLLGLVFAAVRPWLPGEGPRQGLWFGGALLGLLPTAFAVFGVAGAAPDEVLAGGLFGALFIVYGAALALVMDGLRRRPGSPAGTARGGGERPPRTRSLPDGVV